MMNFVSGCHKVYVHVRTAFLLRNSGTLSFVSRFNSIVQTLRTLFIFYDSRNDPKPENILNAHVD